MADRQPEVPREPSTSPSAIDLIALTHGHGDHVGDTVELWKQFEPPVIALVELRGWLDAQGVARRHDPGPNKGGTVDVDGIKITLTDANHSSSAADGTYAGEPAGLVIELEDGFTIYFAGDTNVFGDMALIGRIYEPDVAVMPIGDHFTMGPREAAVALELLGVEALRPVPLRDVPAAHRHAGRAARARPRRRGARPGAGRDDRAVSGALARRDRASACRRSPSRASSSCPTTCSGWTSADAESCMPRTRPGRPVAARAATPRGRQGRARRIRRSPACSSRPSSATCSTST